MAREKTWSKQEVQYFAQRVFHYYELLGLRDYKLTVNSTNDKDNWAAKCHADPNNRYAVVTINLSVKRPTTQTKTYLDRWALHEVLHLLLWEIAEPMMEKDNGDSVEHAVIRRLENFILGVHYA